MISEAEAYGLKFQYPAGDSILGPALLAHGEFAKPELDFLITHATAASGAMLDVGANIGAIGLPFAKARPSWDVVAIEAHHGLAGLLAANAAANSLQNVRVLNAAAGPENGQALYPSWGLGESGNYGDLGFHRRGPTKPVLMQTLDEIAPPDTRLVKVDVQGFESEVLAGARNLRSTVRPIWMLEVTGATGEDVVKTLQHDGYRLFWFFSPFVTPSARVPTSSPGAGDINVVALPPGVPNDWQLTEVETLEKPTSAEAFPYLKNYGYDLAE